jgi:hypothetical protein
MQPGRVARWRRISLPGQTNGKNLLGSSLNRWDDALREIFGTPFNAPPKWFAVLMAYVDESGQEQTGKWMCLGGFIGTQDQWRVALELWSSAIRPRKSLHMKRLRFKRESEKKMLIRAGTVPDESGLKPIFTAVRVDDYLDIVRGNVRERLWSGYVTCCYALLVNTLRSIPRTERVAFSFENQDVYSTLANVALSTIIESDNAELRTPDGKSKLAKYSYEPKEPGSPLELADCFAYSVMQNHRDKTSIRGQWTSPILSSNNGVCFGATLDRDYIREIMMRLTEGDNGK